MELLTRRAFVKLLPPSDWFVCPYPPPLPVYVLSEEIPKSTHFAVSHFLSLVLGEFIKQVWHSLWRDSLNSNKQTNILSSSLNKDIHRYNWFWNKTIWKKSFWFSYNPEKHLSTCITFFFLGGREFYLLKQITYTLN